MARSFLQQSLHNKIVSNQVLAYRGKGYGNILADHIGHPAGVPGMFFGHRPDVTCSMNNKLVICEVETADSIATAETIKQIRAFRLAANYYNGLLHVVVPASALAAGQQAMLQHDIHVDLWWYA